MSNRLMFTLSQPLIVGELQSTSRYRTMLQKPVNPPPLDLRPAPRTWMREGAQARPTRVLSTTSDSTTGGGLMARTRGRMSIWRCAGSDLTPQSPGQVEVRMLNLNSPRSSTRKPSCVGTSFYPHVVKTVNGPVSTSAAGVQVGLTEPAVLR